MTISIKSWNSSPNLLDNLLDLLENVGEKLKDLDLYAVDQLDMKALAMISIYCKNLGWCKKSYFQNLDISLQIV